MNKKANGEKEKNKSIPVTDRGGHRIVRRRRSHIYQIIDSEMAVRSALRVGRPLPLGRFLVLISVTVCVDPRAIVMLE
jgi:hypothetical protein